MTPDEYSAHVKAWRRKERRTQQRFAVLSMLYANAHRDPKKSGFTVEDFMGSFAEEEADQ
jgi:hypothetical protein